MELKSQTLVQAAMRMNEVSHQLNNSTVSAETRPVTNVNVHLEQANDLKGPTRTLKHVTQVYPLREKMSSRGTTRIQ